MSDHHPALSADEFASLREVGKGDAQGEIRSCTGSAWSPSAVRCGGSENSV